MLSCECKLKNPLISIYTYEFIVYHVQTRVFISYAYTQVHNKQFIMQALLPLIDTQIHIHKHTHTHTVYIYIQKGFYMNCFRVSCGKMLSSCLFRTIIFCTIIFFISLSYTYLVYISNTCRFFHFTCLPTYSPNYLSTYPPIYLLIVCYFSF